LLIQLVNEIFEDYPLPVNWREEDFELDVRENAISREDSFLLMEGGQPIGFLLLSERGHTARIDSMGVVRAKRGTGASEILLQHALENLRWKNTKRLILEVIDEMSPILEPKPNVRLHGNSPEQLLDKLVDMISVSQGSPFLLNFDERSSENRSFPSCFA